MHDPCTVAHEIKYPWRGEPSKLWPKGYRSSFITIWHVDPETDGSDDSCGWFMRARHGDKAVFEAIKKDFAFNWDSEHSGWFKENGLPVMSVSATVTAMFWTAAFNHFGANTGRVRRFMRRHLFDILHFAENRTDSAREGILGKYGFEKREDRIASHASMVYGCVLRWTQPWYRHPRWHVWHWRLQIHPWQLARRWLLTRCAHCGGRFRYGESPVSHGWGSGKRPRWFRGEVGLYHDRCSHAGYPSKAA